jgi:glycosyltransferase involved in cell wall biosynthesis
MATDGAPKVSIGMPLYNEERFVGAAIAALLAQSHRDLELIISDNASTDRTGEICCEIAATDSRIRYCRNETRIGAAANFDRLIHMAQGSYFLWAGGHDSWDPELLARSVAALDACPDAVLAGAECVWLDDSGATVARRSGFTDTSGMSSVERFFTVLWGNMHPVLGLIRLDALRRTAGMQSSMGADLLLLTELALQGDFIFVPGTRWYRRETRPRETYAQMVSRHRSAQYRLAQGVTAAFPLLSLGTGLIGVAWRSGLPFATRLAMCAGLAGIMPARYFGARLRRR